MNDNKWIPASERKPTLGQYVLVGWAGCTNIDRAYYSESGWWKSDYRFDKCPPTHWQPLPEPPPKPDAFEEWRKAHIYHGKLIAVTRPDNSGVWIIDDGAAREVWKAALASTTPQ